MPSSVNLTLSIFSVFQVCSFPKMKTRGQSLCTCSGISCSSSPFPLLPLCPLLFTYETKKSKKSRTMAKVTTTSKRPNNATCGYHDVLSNKQQRSQPHRSSSDQPRPALLSSQSQRIQMRQGLSRSPRSSPLSKRPDRDRLTRTTPRAPRRQAHYRLI